MLARLCVIAVFCSLGLVYHSCEAGIKSLWFPQEGKNNTRPTVGGHHGGSSQVICCLCRALVVLRAFENDW